MTNIVVKVIRKSAEASDIVSCDLVSSDGEPLPDWEPGAHIDVRLANGMVRQYSLCSAVGQQSGYRIAVLRDPNSRGGSLAVHALGIGDTLSISEPRNLFPLKDGAHSTLLLAGGIGITPLLAMAWQLNAKGRPFELHYFVRSRSRAAFLSELQRSPFGQQVFVHADDEPGKSSSVVRLLHDALESAGDSHIYTCGPAGFLKHVLETANLQGWPEGQIHYESFSSMQPTGGATFEVRIPSLDKAVTVGSDETVVAAVSRLGLDIPMSCEQGICGTCLTRVLEGTPDHRDMYLTDEERAANDQFLPCCSRSLSAFLVLDL